MSEPLERLFFKEKPVLALLAVEEIKNAYAAKVAKYIDSTVPHTSLIISEFERLGLVTSKPSGRTRQIELTDRGRAIVHKIKELSLLLGKQDSETRRLERLVQMAATNKGSNKAFALGPLRRDIAKTLKRSDEQTRKAFLDLDSTIKAALQEQ